MDTVFLFFWHLKVVCAVRLGIFIPVLLLRLLQIRLLAIEFVLYCLLRYYARFTYFRARIMQYDEKHTNSIKWKFMANLIDELCPLGT